MKRYHIGLDFGTNQTKVCVYHLDNQVHEFFRFSNNTYFLPSRVALKSDGTLEYGSKTFNEIQEEYHYFKIASAEDPEFYEETFQDNIKKDETFYKFNEFKRFSPEFLSVAYLTFVLFEIKERYNKTEVKSNQGGGLLGRLLGRQDVISEETSFTCQLGIPTEWSQKKNLRRKRKFENILLLSELLQRKYVSQKSFLSIQASTLVNAIEELQVLNKTKSIGEFEDKLNDFGLSVYPETAAGLTFIIKTRQIDPGYYAAMDIGAGSTDVSFFKVLENQTIRYLASESYLMAANNVYQVFAGDCNTIEELKKGESAFHLLLKKKSLNEGDKQSIKNAQLYVHRNLQKLLKRLFAKRVISFRNSMLQKYTDQPIIMYGGGAQLPILSDEIFELFDNGVPYAFNMVTYIEKIPINRFAGIINIIPDDRSWDDDFPMLVVALGLSYIKPDNAAEWFINTYYHPVDFGAELVPHPTNEDRFVYDVLLSKWSN